MARSFTVFALLASLPLTILANPMPQSHMARSVLTKRLEDGVDCVGSSVDAPADMFFCFDSAGQDLSCDECSTASTDQGVSCYVSTGDSGSLGNKVGCPMDTAPKDNPDGSPTDPSLGEAGLMAYCQSPVGGGEFATVVKLGICLAYGAAKNADDPAAAATAGMEGLCDTAFAGACSFFEAEASGILDPIDCIPDEQNPDLCSFANPGK